MLADGVLPRPLRTVLAEEVMKEPTEASDTTYRIAYATYMRAMWLAEIATRDLSTRGTLPAPKEHGQ